MIVILLIFLINFQLFFLRQCLEHVNFKIFLILQLFIYYSYFWSNLYYNLFLLEQKVNFRHYLLPNDLALILGVIEPELSVSEISASLEDTCGVGVFKLMSPGNGLL